MRNFEDIVNYIANATLHTASRWINNIYTVHDQIGEVLEMFSDEHSRDLYCREIAFCVMQNFLSGENPSTIAGLMNHSQWKDHMVNTANESWHPEIEINPHAPDCLNYCKTATFHLQQYQYRDIVRVESGDICLDFGACLGDTSIWFCDNGAKTVYAFEIDKGNITAMQRTFSKNGLYDKIKLIHKALASKNGTIYFLPGGHVGAGRVSEQKPAAANAYEVECVTLDKFCIDNCVKPDFIKMDIEGAELDAISGSKDVFFNLRPKFAICIYHDWSHRYLVPLALKELCPDYHFFLKKSHPIYETVFFGIPSEKIKKNADSNQITLSPQDHLISHLVNISQQLLNKNQQLELALKNSGGGGDT